jgi:cytochrome b pre-mRNA-processing protein 3
MASLGGRLGAYREALANSAEGPLEAAVQRNVTLMDEGGVDPLARRLRALSDGLAELPTADILVGRIEW